MLFVMKLIVWLHSFWLHRSVGCWILLYTVFTAIRKSFCGSSSGTCDSLRFVGSKLLLGGGAYYGDNMYLEIIWSFLDSHKSSQYVSDWAVPLNPRLDHLLLCHGILMWPCWRFKIDFLLESLWISWRVKASFYWNGLSWLIFVAATVVGFFPFFVKFQLINCGLWCDPAAMQVMPWISCGF
jgi:hypothetical protein